MVLFKYKFSYTTIFLLSSLLLLSSCSKQLEGNIYFPLQQGLSWTYDVVTKYPGETNRSELTISNIGKQTFDEKSYYVRRTSSGIDYFINSDEQGVYREGLRTLVELKPRLDRERRYVLKFPLVEATSWREISRPMVLLRVFPYRERVGEKSQVPLLYRIESMSSTVSVPAGTFENCIKVIAEGVIEMYTDAVVGQREIPITTEEWYAPNVGLVKQVRYELDGLSIDSTGTPVFLGGHTSLELASFNK